MKTIKSNQTSYAIGKYIRISPKKVRKVLLQLNRKSYLYALMCLEFMPYKACEIIWKLIYSASANALYKFNTKKELLVISSVQVQKGPILKRFRIRAKGNIVAIQKVTSHIKITIEIR
uniref:Large ribosomal subunit protein uL22c n=1 Tax=Pteridomonas sp. YPF1301 TaxID=2766739 RepID=A0A7G1MNG1_9STRA|nr:ribosomal protein L22 [Pteridomonas sp. YPF1301]